MKRKIKEKEREARVEVRRMRGSVVKRESGRMRDSRQKVRRVGI